MNRPPLEVADLVRAAGRAFIEHSRRWITWQCGGPMVVIEKLSAAQLQLRSPPFLIGAAA